MVVDVATQFGRDMKRLEKRGKDMDKLHAIVEALRTRQPLPPKNRDHALSGKWNGFRDCHVEPDWVLIYELSPHRLGLARTGSHSDLELD
ncbi:MAG: type II toxin-antitoxin system YafQ family toxin [Isosphaeraceae bacterium]